MFILVSFLSCDLLSTARSSLSCTRVVLLIALPFIASLLVPSSAVSQPSLKFSKAKILWVSDSTSYGGVYNDQGFVTLLEHEGYEVQRVSTLGDGDPLTPEEINLLNSANVVIVSRDTNSNGYNDRAGWQQVRAPTIVLNPFLLRKSRWQWVNTDTVYLPGGPEIGQHEDTFGPRAHYNDFPFFTAATGKDPASVGENKNITWEWTAAYLGIGNIPGRLLIDARIQGDLYAFPFLIVWPGYTGGPFYPGSSSYPWGYKAYIALGSHGASNSRDIGSSYSLLFGKQILINLVQNFILISNGLDPWQRKYKAQPCDGYTAGRYGSLIGDRNSPQPPYTWDLPVSGYYFPEYFPGMLEWAAIYNSLEIAEESAPSGNMTEEIARKAGYIGKKLQVYSKGLPRDFFDVDPETRLQRTRQEFSQFSGRSHVGCAFTDDKLWLTVIFE